MDDFFDAALKHATSRHTAAERPAEPIDNSTLLERMKMAFLAKCAARSAELQRDAEQLAVLSQELVRDAEPQENWRPAWEAYHATDAEIDGEESDRVSSGGEEEDATAALSRVLNQPKWRL